MTISAQDMRTLVVERFVAHPPEKIWRVLTQSWLIREWLMENDFELQLGRRFSVRASALPGWSGVTNCEIVLIEAPCRLAYRWGDGSESDIGLETLVSWTLSPRDGGTVLRMEQSGFPPDDGLSYRRIGKIWQRAFTRLDAILAKTQQQETER